MARSAHDDGRIFKPAREEFPIRNVPQRNNAAQARQVIRDVIQIFGVERTIYGSNFPSEKLHASYGDFFGVYRTIPSEYPEAAQRAVLHDNALKFYRL